MTSSNVHSRWSVRLNAFEELTTKWKHVQLQSLQRQDERESIQQAREQLNQSRRHLSSRTKEFAKYTAEEKAAELGGLVKSYQGHVDELTKSLKHVDALYADLMERVRSMTDPYPMMEKFSREKQTILEFVAAGQEAEQLRRVVAEREAELAGLKNQEVTIANLREQLADAQHERADAVQQTAKDASSEWEMILRGYQQREASASLELSKAQQEAVRWKLLQQGTAEQVASLRSKLEDTEASREKEIGSLVEELDEANTQIALRDRELRRVSEAAVVRPPEDASTPGSGAPTPLRSSSVRAASMMLEEHVSELQRALSTLEAQRHQEQAQWSSEREQMRADHDVHTQSVTKELRDRNDSLVAQLDAAQSEIISQKAFARGLQEEVQRTQNALRMLEAELMQIERTAPASGASDLKLPVPGASSEAPENVPELEDTFVALATQRDRLRQRLLALEEASSQEIHRLQMEVQELKMDRNNSLSLSVLATSADHDEVSRKPLLLFHHGRLNVTTEAIVEVLDRGNMLLSRFVLSNLQWRRGFVAYLILLHTYFALSTLLSVFFG